ncbi:MAG: aldo/keto reductase [Lentisphaerae bacterium]|jgi:myo-inositol catabolism protein IolS|nr:aldo/keto reductase [Lentisphaerota bacterium]MBT5606484.1 aldo/keto reductase [Lentisphaerota bacterium]MBT7058856.1 aldo/keto reductase [Lentisphaerota bacterium]MBT7846483.1 aldo/keto reductase [Lentisphaerota bacterium]
MEYRTLGSSGIEVSEIGFGAWQVGGELRAYFDKLGWISHGWGDVRDEDAIELIRSCGELGINFIDTAAGYGAGHSEEVVGRAVQEHRADWVIETKGGEGFHEDGVNYRDFSRDHLLTQIERSLTRLATDHVDVYLLHGPSQEDIERGECLDALARIKASGKARLVGVSLGPSDMGIDLIRRGLVDVFQVVLSLTDAHMAEELLPAAASAGVGIVARCAFGAGFLAGGIDETTPFAENDRRSWQTEASKRARADAARAFDFLTIEDRTPAQSCLKYPLSFAGVSTVIPGSKSVAHMRENAATTESPDLTAAEFQGVVEARRKLTS